MKAPRNTVVILVFCQFPSIPYHSLVAPIKAILHVFFFNKHSLQGVNRLCIDSYRFTLVFMATYLKYYFFLRFVSITLVFVNKSLLSGFTKLDAPLFVTFFQCVVTVLACYVLRYVHSDSSQHGFFNIY